MNRIFVLGLVIMLLACDTGNTYYDTIFTKNKLPENIPFGSGRDVVLSQFGMDNLAEHSTQFLFFDFPLNGNDSYTLAYKFYKDSLYGVEVGIFTQESEKSYQLFDKIVSEFNKTFGQHKKIDPKQHIWYFNDEKTHTKVEIEARNDSGKYGVITVLFNDLEF